MRVSLDEQIFAVQPYGGISRLFYEMARIFVNDSSLGVELNPLCGAIINEYVLADKHLAAQLKVRRSSNPYRAIAGYLVRPRNSFPSDVVHNTFYLPRGLADHRSSKRVVTVYDMIPELLPKTRRRMDFLTAKHSYVRRADHIICISESTRRDLLRVYPDTRAPISIAYPGVSAAFHPGVARIEGLPEPYILHVGHRASYKDGSTLIRAFAAISKHFPDHTLLFVGGGPLTRQERSMIVAHGLSDRIMQRTLADHDVPAAYAQASVTVFPSRYEGFGLPALEAMASGSPLILAQTSSLPEVGGGAARYFPPGDDRTLAAVLSEVLGASTIQSELCERGLAQARRFTWLGYAEANVAAYHEVLG